MDFSYMGGNEWNTDQISSSTAMNFDNNDIFMTQPKIDEQLRWPAPTHQYPNPEMQMKYAPPHDGYVTSGSVPPQITENMLIILLLVILIVMCTMIYITVKQTCEAIKLLTSILASKVPP
jgi:hypothetical protein